MRSIAFAAAALLATTAASADEWRDVDPENLVVMDVTYGRILIELAPQFSPAHAQRFRELVRAKFYDGKTFYRVIDGFVAQGGEGEDEEEAKDKDAPAKPPVWPALKAEFDRAIGEDVHFEPLGSPDLFAEEVGHVDGFPAGRDFKDGRMWILHCPGTLAMARDTNPDTGSTEFYVPIGHGPRRLDRNLSAFGRVLDGMQFLQKLNRGDPKVENGVIQDAAKRDPIVRVQIAADMPKAERPRLQVMDTRSRAFADYKTQRRNPSPEFYKRQAPNLDICAFNAPVQHAPSSTAAVKKKKSGKHGKARKRGKR